MYTLPVVRTEIAKVYFFTHRGVTLRFTDPDKAARFAAWYEHNLQVGHVTVGILEDGTRVYPADVDTEE